jgi:hypothetical protein
LRPFRFSGFSGAIYVGGRSYYSHMRSINDVARFDRLLDAIEAAHDRVLALPFDWLTRSELLSILKRYEFLMGRLDALEYELTSPFGRPGRRTKH